VDNIIAERELTFRADGSDADEVVIVRLGRPHVGKHAPLYTTEYEIVGPGEDRYAFHAAGADSMQALGLVFVALWAHLDRLKRGGKLTWLGSEELHIPSGQ
jgi:hypothetical protein